MSKFTQLTLSDNGAQFIARNEGSVLHSYKDTGGVWTGGIGHTGKDVLPNMTISLAQEKAWFLSDSATVIAEVNNLQEQTQRGFNQNQFDALIDLIFNAGIGHFLNTYPALWNFIKADTLDYNNISSAWLNFCVHDATGKVVPGLQTRRQKEVALYFLSND